MKLNWLCFFFCLSSCFAPKDPPVDKEVSAPIDYAADKDVAPPPKPKYLKEEVAMRKEVEDLNDQREIKVKQFVRELVGRCNAVPEDSIVMAITITPNGQIEKYDILRMAESAVLKADCINDYVSRSEKNLGQTKIIPSARTGSKPRTTSYTLPIR